jgi:Protein kinase domain/PEGA domain
VLHQIGIGTLGPVFRTYEPTRDRLVAVKVFRLDIIPEQAQVLADALSRATQSSLVHPSIVEPIASGVEGTVAFRAEEYVAAESLDVAMRHYAPASIEKALPFITQLAGAIDFARAAGVGHGGLHPRDIFVTPDEARATGFGVVEALEEVGIRAPIRRPYTAPERIAGSAWGTPADVFSLAAITFELLTGRRPAGTGAQAGALPEGKHSAEIHAVLARALDDDPGRRYASALAFAGALESAARGEAEAIAVAEVAAIAAISPAVIPLSAVPVSAVPVVVTELTTAGPGDQETPEEIAIEEPLDARHEAPADIAIAAAAPPRTLFDEDEDEEEDGLDMKPVVETERFTEDFVEEEDFLPEFDQEAAAEAEAVAAAPADDFVLDQSEYAAEKPMLGAADPEPDPPEYHDAPERSGAFLLPFAVTAVLSLLVGFAAGHFVGARSRQMPGVAAQPAVVGAARPAPAPTVAATPEKPGQSSAGAATPDRPGQYSEQKVTAPPPALVTPAPAPAPPAPRPSSGQAPRPTSGQTPRPDSGQPPPARIAGHLVVRSSPSRASVTLNGQWRGRTPLTLDALPFGKYVVRVVQDGFNVAREEVTLSPQDASRTIDARLEAKARGGASLRPTAPELPRPSPPPAAAPRPSPAPAPPVSLTGSLYVDSRPRGATVIVDGKTMGMTPLTMVEVATGPHVIRIEMTGKKSWMTAKTVIAGQMERVTGSLEDQR